MKILVTTDGSARSLQALPHASRLATALGGEMVVCRVLDPRQDCGKELTPTLQEAVGRLSERWTRDLAAILEARGVNARPRVAVRRHGEDLHESILRTVADEQADVVAMSTRGVGVLRHAVLGSVALGVLSRTPVPILMTGDHAGDPRGDGRYQVVVTNDGSVSSLPAVRAVAALAANPGMSVTLLRVHTPRLGDEGDAAEVREAEENLRGLTELFPDPAAVPQVVRTIVRLGGVDSAIVDFANQRGADAIAIATHGHSARYHIFAGSTALGVLRQSPLPVLLVRSNPSGTTSVEEDALQR